MFCPNCKKGEVKEQSSMKGFWRFKRKEIYYFCPLCEWENKKTFKLSKEDVDLERLKELKTNRYVSSKKFEGRYFEE